MWVHRRMSHCSSSVREISSSWITTGTSGTGTRDFSQAGPCSAASGFPGRRVAQFEMVCERPPRSLRSRLPLTKERVAEGGKGAAHTPSKVLEQNLQSKLDL